MTETQTRTDRGTDLGDTRDPARAYELDRAHVFHSWSAQAEISPMVVTRAEGISGQWEWSPDFRRYYTNPQLTRGSVSVSGSRGRMDYTLGVDNSAAGQASADLRELPEPLTLKEIRVLQLLAEGYSNSAMAEKLFVSDSTVRTHLRNINTKLKAHSRTQAVAIARRLRMIA